LFRLSYWNGVRLQFELSFIRFVIVNRNFNNYQTKFKVVSIVFRGTLLALACLYNSEEHQFTVLALALTGIKSWYVRFQNSVTDKLITVSFLLDGYPQDLLVYKIQFTFSSTFLAFPR
jgi:hypothetical protein